VADLRTVLPRQPVGALRLRHVALDTKRDRARPPLGPLDVLCQYVFDLRLVAVALALVPLAEEHHLPPGTMFALGVALATSYVGLRKWPAIVARVRHHPQYLALDVALGVVLLGAVGPASPFLYYTVGSVLLAGLLYSKRATAITCAVLCASFLLLLAVSSAPDSSGPDLRQLVGLPALYPLAAVGGLAVRRLLEQQAQDSRRIGELAIANAAAAERTRLAREMHDTLSKTLHGITLGSSALAHSVQADPARAGARAEELGAMIGVAHTQARALIDELRLDQPDLPLAQTVRGIADRWSAGTGTTVTVSCDAAAEPELGGRYELVAVLAEALTNTARHAQAQHVDIRLDADRGRVRLVVSDDGQGFVTADDGRPVPRTGHYGLVGMNERAQRAGGSLAVRSSPGCGTTVSVNVPVGN